MQCIEKTHISIYDHPFGFLTLFIPLTTWVTSGINCGPDLRNLYDLLLYQSSVDGCLCTAGSHLNNNKKTEWEDAPACIHFWIWKYSWVLSTNAVMYLNYPSQIFIQSSFSQSRWGYSYQTLGKARTRTVLQVKRKIFSVSKLLLLIGAVTGDTDLWSRHRLFTVLL